MTIIKILIYTDIDKISADDCKAQWSICILQALLKEHKSQFVQYELKVINRYQGCAHGKLPSPPAPVRITEKLLEDVDQIWFFGWFQKNAGEKFDRFFGTNQNELDPKTEVAVLSKWMNERGLGVLISGDHSSPFPPGTPTSPPASFVCLGRALGHLVPRAGQLRAWDGPPSWTPCENIFSTVVETGGNPVGLPSDHVPQKLELVNFSPEGSPAQFHRIFLGKDEDGQDSTIDVFPDHQHEGEVLLLKSLNSEWPPFDESDTEKKEPKPLIVARGHDKHLNRSIPVLAVYEGDTHRVGRIVADSSWHHFFDENLKGFKESGSPTLGLLGQFYRNLALYLAPLKLRRQISREMFDWATSHPSVLEEVGTEPSHLGRLATHYLSEVATPCEIAEMFHVETLAASEVTDLLSDVPMLASGNDSMLPPQELIIGSVINEQFTVSAARLEAELAKAQSPVEDAPQPDAVVGADDADIASDNDKIIAEGIKKAFRSHHARLAQIASETKIFSNRLNEADHTKEGQMAEDACTTTEENKWTSRFIRNGEEEDDGIIEITKGSDGKLEGKHLKSKQSLKDVKCDGTTISFSRVEKIDGKEKEVKYKDATISVMGGYYVAVGKFEKHDKPVNTEVQTQGGKRDKDKDKDVTNSGDSGEWQAEKPIA